MDHGSICCRILRGVAIVLVRIKIGGDEEEGSVLSGGSFEFACDGNFEGVGPGEDDTLGFS